MPRIAPFSSLAGNPLPWFRFLPLFATLVLAQLAARAQGYTWRTVEIGGGGFVTGTVFHPTEPGLVYARTDVGGAYRLDASTGRWVALNDDIGGLNNEFQHLGVLTIGLDPSDPNRLYLATGQYGGTESWKLPSRIYRSSNRGATWDGYVVPGFKMAGNGEGRGTGERMAVNPENGAILLVGTSDAGIWRSLDRGVTWARLSGFPAAIVHLNYVQYAPASASGPGPARRVYAAGRTLANPSLWQSDDNGDTWTETPGQPGRVPGQEMFALMGSFDAAGTYYVTWGDESGPGTYQDHYTVAKVAAGSSVWTNILPPTGQGGFAGISADPRVAGHVVVTTLHRWWPGDEVYRSTNGGSTWSAVLRSSGTTRSPGNSPWATSAGPHWMTDVDIDPFNSDRVLFNTGFGLFQTTNLSSSNSSRVWTFFNDGLEELVPLGLLSPTAGPPLISVTGDYTGFRHDNLNRSPRRGAHAPMTGSNAALSGAPLAPLRMLRQHSSDTLVSSDAGVTWSRFSSTPPSAINGHNRTVLSADGTRLLWAPAGSGAYLTTSNGSSWSPVPSGALLINADRRLQVSTLAGTLGTAGSTGGSGTAASFNAPEAIALGPTGVRYVADTGNHTVRTIGSGGSVGTLAGTAGSAGATDASGASARFRSPAGIVFANGAVFVADTGNHTLRRVTTAGAVTTFAGSAGVAGTTNATGTAARFNSPRGLAADDAGNLYVADTGNHVIRKVTSAGVVTLLAGSPGVSGATDGPAANARFNAPRGVAVDAAGVVYVADTGNHVIRRIGTDGQVTTLAGQAGTAGFADGNPGAARFSSPASVAVDANLGIHVSDTNNHVIRRVTAAGTVSTVAGTAGATGTAGGEGASARFSSPAGLVAQPDGFVLYATETGNHGVRTLGPFRTLTPVADRADANRLYLWSATARTLLASTDGGATFVTVNSALPTGVASLRTVPGKAGHVWARAGTNGLHQSTNGGASFTKLGTVSEVYQFDFGREAPGASHPAVYIWGRVGGVLGFFRSDNSGATWTRINTNLQQFGYINDLVADARTYGRVYLGTSGRGVVVGEPAPASPLPSQPSQLIYGDAAASGWTNTSTSGVSLTSTTHLRRGTAAIAVPASTPSTTYSASFASAARSLTGYSALSFWVTPGTSGSVPPLRVGAARGGIQLEAYPVAVPAGSGWRRVIVPLQDLGLDGIEDLTALRIEGDTVGGTPPGAFWLDDIALIGTSEFLSPAQIHLAGLVAAFDGTPKSIVVTTTPAGRETVVTYNGSPLPPSAIGTYSVVATLLDPFSEGSASATFTLRNPNAGIQLGNLSATADGTPRFPTVITEPEGLSYVLTFDGSTTPPTLAGSYTVVATLTDPLYAGSSTATFTLRNRNRGPLPVTGWASNIAGKVSAESTASPTLTPDDTTDGFSTNTLHAHFSPIRLANLGDTLRLSGSFQLETAVTGNTTNWFRFGLFDNRGQDPATITGWLGGASIGGAYWERTSASGLFTTGTGATSRSPDTAPAPVTLASPAGNPPIAFSIEATLVGTGVKLRHTLRRTDTNAVLLDYTHTDTTPNNNGGLSGSNANAIGYLPTYSTVGFGLGRTYVGSTPPRALFSNVSLQLIAGAPLQQQTISFPRPADRQLDVSPFPLSATASSGLPVSFEIVSGPATLTGGLVTLTGAGTVTVRALQAGNETFDPAPPVFQSFEATRIPASVQLSELIQPYTGGPRSPNVSTSPEGLPIRLEFDGEETAPVSVGTYTVVATVTDDRYNGAAGATFTIERGPQTITFPAIGDRGVGALFAPGATSTSQLAVRYEIVSGPAETDGVNVVVTDLGTVTLRALQDGDARYLPAVPIDRTFNAVAGTAVLTLGDLSWMYDGQPKTASVDTLPAGLPVRVTYNGSEYPPVARGTYSVIATVEDPRYAGSVSGQLVIAPRSVERDLTGWTSSNPTVEVGSAATASPVLNAAGLAGGASGTTLHAFFEPVTLAQPGDRLVLSGSFQLSAPGASGQTHWFRFGLFDSRSQPAGTLSGWLGYVGMGNGLFERTSGAGGAVFTSTSDATQRGPDASPTPISSLSPVDAPPIRFEVTATRIVAGVNASVSGILVTHTLVRTDTNATLMRYSYTDTSPHNNGGVSGSNTAANPTYLPVLNAAGFSLSTSYVTPAHAHSVSFQNVRVRFEAGSDVPAQTLTFDPLPDIPYSPQPLPLSAISSSGLPVQFERVSGPATVNGASLTLTGIGEVVLRALQPGNLVIPPAAPVERTFSVVKGEALVLLEDASVPYDGGAAVMTPQTVPAGLMVRVTYNESINPPVAPGTYSVRAQVEDPLYAGESVRTLQIIDTLQSAPRAILEPIGGGFRLRIPAQPGYLYQLQRATDLVAADWSDVGSALPGPAGELLLEDTSAGIPANRFYRVVITPAVP